MKNEKGTGIMSRLAMLIALLISLSLIFALSSCTVTLGGAGTNNSSQKDDKDDKDSDDKDDDDKDDDDTNSDDKDDDGTNSDDKDDDDTNSGDKDDDGTNSGDKDDDDTNSDDKDNDNDDPSENLTYEDNYVIVKFGILSNGKTRDYFKYGSSITIYAEDFPGMYFDYWTKNGERIEGGEELTVTADADSNIGSVETTYVACYKMSDYATFEDASYGTVTDVSSDRYYVSIASISDKVTAEVIVDPDDIRNNVIKFVDADTESAGAIGVNIAAIEGDFLVYTLDFFVQSYDGTVPFTIVMGNYNLEFYAVDGKLKICDNASGTAAYLKTSFDIGEWHNLKVYVCNKEINNSLPHSFVLLDGDCVAKSYNVSAYSFANVISLGTSEQSELAVYIDNIGAHRANLSEAEETAMNPSYVLEKGYVSKNAYYQAEIILDDEALAALKAMDAALFSEDIYRWIANLYDPETSAIYFSISGRDNYGYLPDIETVAQGYGILSTIGIGGASTVLNDEQKANLLSWIQTLQSNRDGYYYHPHWGVSINNSRLSRDLGNSSSSYSASGGLAFRLFDDANYRLSGGSSGYGGVTSPSVYDNSLTVKLASSSVSQVSKILMTSSMSSMPVHLRSEENLVRHINTKWNDTCKVPGVHERHFCTEKCVIVEDSSDSYMKIEDGKLVITRGYRCTSCHVCSHTLGHSYSFGHYFTSMGAQVRSAGLGTPLVMYFYDIQENVQASLRDQAQEAYIEENGEDAWKSLTPEEQTAIRKAAENGIWEEKVTYNTISGLLKISGIPTAHGYEFLYAEAAINSAIDGALFSTEDFISRREAIVSIYNPFNAINGIMNNIRNYGSDPSVRTEAMALIRSRAKDLIENTSVKLACYLMPDGGYSYNMSGYCTNSQGQPVAINGWNNGLGEGDVNGTALALGTRSALVSCLGISVGAPFSGDRAKYSDEGYDLDCNGIIEGDELNATHTQVFRSLITNKSEIQKVDTAVLDSNYDFEGDDPLMPSGGTVINEGGNRVLEVVDNQTGSGLTTSFLSGNLIGSEQRTEIKFDMKVIESNNTTSHQLFGGSNNSIYINFTYKNGIFTFANKLSNSSYQTLTDVSTGKTISVNAKEWFTIEISAYVGGKIIDGRSCYGVFKITQNGVTQTDYLSGLNNSKPIDSLKMYSLNSAVNKVYYDNVSCNSIIIPGVYDGEYHFDSTAQKISDKLTSSPTNEKDTVYPLVGGEKGVFTPDSYSTSYVIYNFDYFQGGVHLGEAVAGDRVYYTFLDTTSKRITGVYLEVNDDGTVTFYAANGQKLTMTNTRREDVTEPAIIDMTLDVDTSKWLTVKLEYHYDLGEPQLDVVVRYADESNNSYNRTVASTLTGVTTLDEGARPKLFNKFNIEYVSEESGKIYLDDLYIRNVYVP